MSTASRVTTIKLRRGPASEWTADNPVLKSGEPGVETDTYKFKIGDGIHNWADLDYFLDQTATEALITDMLGEGGGSGPHTHPESDIVNLVSDLAAKAAASALTSHTSNVSNPHSVTKAQVGLGSVDNTADSAKPVSAATQTALDAKASASGLSTHIADTSNPHSVTKTQVGLGNVDNTADSAKPVSAATQTALDLKSSLAGPTFTGVVNVGQIVSSVHSQFNDGMDVTGSIHKSVGTLTTAANPVVADASDADNFFLALDTSVFLDPPSNPEEGQMLMFEIQQDSGGGNTMGLSGDILDPNAYYTGVSSDADSVSFLGLRYSETKTAWCVLAFTSGY